MPVSVSTDAIRPSERQAFWTEAICRSFASVDTRPLGATVSGHFEFVEIGQAKLVRFDSSPQCYSRDARLVSRAGSDDFMFDFQTVGRSVMTQGSNEAAIAPGLGVLYDARRPFRDRLDGPERRAEVLIATVPAAALLASCPDAERLCALPIPLSSAIGQATQALVRAAIRTGDTARAHDDADIVAYLTGLLRQAAGAPHGLSRPQLLTLVDMHLRRRMADALAPPALAWQFAVSERTLHRAFADRDTTFERHLLRRRVERLRRLLGTPCLSGVPIARLALDCGFADAAHAARTFRRAFGQTPRDYRAERAAGTGAGSAFDQRSQDCDCAASSEGLN